MALFELVTVFLNVTSNENVGEGSVYITMSVNVPITLTSISLRKNEHRNQVNNKDHPVPPVSRMLRAKTFIFY
jgi:hypothetical protein